MIERLNADFGVDNRLKFGEGRGGFTEAGLTTDSASAVVSLYGGQVLSYVPRGEKDVLWVSRQAFFEAGKAVRGGIPICWPWFNAHPTDSDKPSHGFARLLQWHPVASEVSAEGEVCLTLGLSPSDFTRALWPYDFGLELRVKLGNELSVELTTVNLGESILIITEALHSYFAVSDIANVTLNGLENTAFIDSLTGQHSVEDVPLAIDREVDRVYLDTRSDCVIEDRGWGRRICIGRTGSNSAVVWNPWVDKAERMSDFGNEEYRGMLCVEATNTHADAVSLPPGGRHALGTVISVI